MFDPQPLQLGFKHIYCSFWLHDPEKGVNGRQIDNYWDLLEYDEEFNSSDVPLFMKKWWFIDSHEIMDVNTANDMR